MVPSNRTRGNGQKLMYRKFHLNMRKNCTVKVTEHCNRLPRVVVESPSLEISKSHLDTILRKQLWDAARAGRLGQVVPSNLTHSDSCSRCEAELINWEKSNQAGAGKASASTEINVLISQMDIIFANVCC